MPGDGFGECCVVAQEHQPASFPQVRTRFIAALLRRNTFSIPMMNGSQRLIKRRVNHSAA
jgi:hypothetical protein